MGLPVELATKAWVACRRITKDNLITWASKKQVEMVISTHQLERSRDFNQGLPILHYASDRTHGKKEPTSPIYQYLVRCWLNLLVKSSWKEYSSQRKFPWQFSRRLHVHCWGLGFNTWLGELGIYMACDMAKIKKLNKILKNLKKRIQFTEIPLSWRKARWKSRGQIQSQMENSCSFKREWPTV